LSEEDAMLSRTAWIVVAVVAVIALAVGVLLGRKSGVSTETYTGPPKDDRFAHAVVVKDGNGKLKLYGGPERHGALPGEKVSWKVVNATGDNVTVEVKIKNSPSGAPPDPFDPNDRKTKPVAAGQTDHLDLHVRPQADFPATTNGRWRYKYAIFLNGDETTGLDPDLDIWR
jgi:hypothetical protein